MFVECEIDHLGDPGEVPIMGEQRGRGARRDGGDHAVDQTAWRHAGPSAAAVDAHRAGEVHDWIEPQEMEAVEQAWGAGRAPVAVQEARYKLCETSGRLVGVP